MHDGAHNEANANKEAGLWDPDGDLLVNVETWTEEKTMNRLDSTIYCDIGHISVSDAPKHTNFGERSQQYPQRELKGDLDPRVVHGKHGKVGPLLVWEGLGLIVERFDGGEAGRCCWF